MKIQKKRTIVRTIDEKMYQLRDIFGEDIRVIVDVTNEGTRLNAAERIDKSDGLRKQVSDEYEVTAEDTRPHYMG